MTMTQQRADYPLDDTTEPKTKDRLREMADGAADHLKHVADSAGEIAGTAAEQAREYGQRAQEAARNFKPYVEKSTREQPMMMLATAAAIGFALGALWKK